MADDNTDTVEKSKVPTVPSEVDMCRTPAADEPTWKGYLSKMAVLEGDYIRELMVCEQTGSSREKFEEYLANLPGGMDEWSDDDDDAVAAIAQALEESEAGQSTAGPSRPEVPEELLETYAQAVEFGLLSEDVVEAKKLMFTAESSAKAEAIRAAAQSIVTGIAEVWTMDKESYEPLVNQWLAAGTNWEGWGEARRATQLEGMISMSEERKNFVNLLYTDLEKRVAKAVHTIHGIDNVTCGTAVAGITLEVESITCRIKKACILRKIARAITERTALMQRSQDVVREMNEAVHALARIDNKAARPGEAETPRTAAATQSYAQVSKANVAECDRRSEELQGQMMELSLKIREYRRRVREVLEPRLEVRNEEFEHGFRLWKLALSRQFGKAMPSALSAAEYPLNGDDEVE